jgi:hypothetical protein
MLDEDEKFFKQNGIPLFSSHMIDLVSPPHSPSSWPLPKEAGQDFR